MYNCQETKDTVCSLARDNMLLRLTLIMAFLLSTSLAMPMENTSEDKSPISEFYDNTTSYLGQPVPVNSSEAETLLLRSHLRNRNQLWPGAKVPYVIDRRFSNRQRQVIQNAIGLIQSVSCVKFVQRYNHRDYVMISWSRYYCQSMVGRVGGVQRVELQNACFTSAYQPGTVVHELMHAIGFIHEHQRDDRNCYLQVRGGNRNHNIRIVFGSDTSWPYDYHSIMHYPQTDFMRGRHGERLGNFQGTLTQLDREKLNHAYCGKPHYCSRNRRECEATKRAEMRCSGGRW